MAVDEAILESYAGTDESLSPTLRLYGWNPAAVSIGRGQAPESLGNLGEFDLVRRPTGGGTVLHQHERTYAVIGRLRSPPFGGGVLETYESISVALVAAMRSLGAEARAEKRGARVAQQRGVCFEALSSYEISVGGRKLIGSAQLRRRGAFLQHGSILLRADRSRLARVVGRPLRDERFTDLETILGLSVAPGLVDGALVRSFEEVFGTTLAPGALTRSEHARVSGAAGLPRPGSAV